MSSHLTPEVNFMLLKGIDDYFKSQTIEITDNLPRLVKKLYAIGDGKLYTIIGVCYQDQYEAVLTTPLLNFIRSSSQEAISFLKESSERGESLEIAIRDVNDFMKVVLEVLRNSTLSSRKAIGDSAVKEVEYPDYGTLKAFYECGRKVKYHSYEEAESNLERVNSIYLCSSCSHYHQGRAVARNAPPLPEDIKLSRYKTVWRRYHKI